MAINRESLRDLLDGPIAALGYELVQLELTGRGDEACLRLFIDAPGGIQLNDCAAVSEHVSALLAVEAPQAAEFVLEVSSPGLDRPLVKSEHFCRFVGREVQLTTREPRAGGQRRFRGRLVQADDEQIAIECDELGREYLRYAEIESARLRPEFN